MTRRPAPAWLAEIPSRPFVTRGIEARFTLVPGDRPLVEAGSLVATGDPLLERLRDRRVDEVVVAAGSPPTAGARWAPDPGSRHRAAPDIEGELLAPAPGGKDRWRLVTAEHRDTYEAPVGGEVVEVLAGGEIRIRVAGSAITGSLAAGSSAHGRLDLATDPSGELRAGGIDVGRAGSILVVGSRIDAEALTRARAMGVRGIVVASLPGKELRDFRASERRQRAALHPAPPFGVLVLEGATRRRIPSPITALLGRLAGREVSLLADPPCLVFDATGITVPLPPPDWVHVRSGPAAGSEGRVVGVTGLRRFAANVMLEAARVTFEDGATADLPIGDLERFA